MKVPICIILAILTNAKSDIASNEVIKYKLYKVLDFIEERYEEFHFDGLFGVTFAHAFLLKSLKLRTESTEKLDITDLMTKCSAIENRIYPLLPDHPKYMISFRNNLLDVQKWNEILPDDFAFGQIKYLGYYKNWTADTIIQYKRATYKGVKSDVCLREILEQSEPNRRCYVSSICEEMMWDTRRVDTGYLLTHRLLYMQIIRLHDCIPPKKYGDMSEFSRIYCSYIYKEAKTSERLNFPHYDIFLEQVVLCGMEGYAEFLNHKWLKRIIEWQNPHGCYESVKQSVTRRTSFQVDYGCSDHTTGLGAAALALYLRYEYFLKSVSLYELFV
ncbi:UPF0764 protein C16orf89 homolog [Anoplophora glabripennis]|uniref:UPF0764 protein C16orf89 homolog n=1 Tax=Anoplophora glabripennis TaxID=217634 RepID=UPI000874E431|nr:UPF0764 protein C16orf89 homolog [Anoplophora glabripennis]